MCRRYRAELVFAGDGAEPPRLDATRRHKPQNCIKKRAVYLRRAVQLVVQDSH